VTARGAHPLQEPEPIPEHLADYRKVLVAADQKGQEELDKAVLSLSGGGLGVSLVFLKDIIGTDPILFPSLLMGAWVAWGISTLAVLLSYHMANLTIRAGIRQIDRGEAYSGPLGGPYAKWTQKLNLVGLVLFFVGVVLITSFVCVNLYGKGLKSATAATGDTASAPSASARPGAGSKGLAAPRSASAAAAATPAATAATAASK
jgi:hypothetical protein